VVPAAGWVVLEHREIALPANFRQLRDATLRVICPTGEAASDAFVSLPLLWHSDLITLRDNRNEDLIVGEEIWATVVSEFSDVPDLSTLTRITMRLMLAAILGGVLGYERERKRRSAGVRTHMLVAVGAALFVIGPMQSGMPIEDMSRVLQGIVQGIGFLGAGAIMVRTAQHIVEGLTTAASIWATAGIGIMAVLDWKGPPYCPQASLWSYSQWCHCSCQSHPWQNRSQGMQPD